MPIIKFKDKKRKPENEPVPESVRDEGEYLRNVSLPVNDAILEETEIDQVVVVTIIGTVSGIRSNTSEGYKDKSITVKASSIEVYEHTDDEEAGMKAGYRRGE